MEKNITLISVSKEPEYKRSRLQSTNRDLIDPVWLDGSSIDSMTFLFKLMA